MENYSFPDELARVVIDRWHTYVNRGDTAPPSIPTLPHLRWILETIFLASLETEEGRELRFIVCWVSSRTVLRDDSWESIPFIPLTKSRGLSVSALRSFAPAIRSDGAAILVESTTASGAEIAGILHVGGDYTRAREGKSFYYQRPAYALTIEVRGPGELHVYQGAIKLAILHSGVLQRPDPISSLDFVPGYEILQQGEDRLFERIIPPEHEPVNEWADFQWIALLNTVLSVVNSIKAARHGGTLLFLPPNSIDQLPIKFKYELQSETGFLNDRFISFINTRHKIGDAYFTHENGIPDMTSADEISNLQLLLVALERDLTDAAETIAAFSRVDGALVLTSDLRVLGFGAEILLELASPTKVLEVIGETVSPKNVYEMDSESFGMRHRSAVRFVGATPCSVAFVVSQDGAVSFTWSKNGAVYIKRGVNIANPNMAGS